MTLQPQNDAPLSPAEERTGNLFAVNEPRAQENLSEMVNQLAERGYVVKLDVAASWIVIERELVADWLRGVSDRAPKFLERYRVQVQEKSVSAPKPGLAKTTDAPAQEPSVEAGDKITVTWGDEKLSVEGTYSSFSVGMISATVSVRAGESRVDVARRVYDDLEKLAHEIRARKQSSFLAALKGLAREAKS